MEQELKQIFDTVRIPLVEEACDVYQDGNTFLLEGLAYQHYLNCFPTVNKNSGTGQGDVWISKRNGIFSLIDMSEDILTNSTSNWAVDNITFSQIANTYCAAIFDETNLNHLIISYDGNNTVTLIGTIHGTTSSDFVFLSELNIEDTPYLGVVWHDTNFPSLSNGWFAATTAGAFTASSLTLISDADFPPNQTPALPLRGPMLQMNGTTYVLTLDGRVYGSDLNSITDWNPLNVIRAIQYPDRGVSLARYKHHIAVFGEDSLEFFNDVGNPPPGSALERTEQAFIKFGAAGPRLITHVGDTLYWISSSSSETSSLYKMEGYEPLKVSTNKEENLMGAGVNELRAIQFMNNQCLITDCTVSLGPENVANKRASTYIDGASTASIFTDDANGAFSDEFTQCLLAYNTESQSWWFFKQGTSSTVSPAVFLPLSANHVSGSSLLNLGQGSTIMYKNLNSFVPISLASKVYQSQGYTQGIGTYHDEYTDDDGITTQTPITCAICLNPSLFGTEKIKRIHKLKIIQRIIQTNSLYTYPDIWLLYSKNDWIIDADSVGNKRFFYRKLSTSRDMIRYVYPNLGSGRQWSFCLVSRSSATWQVKVLEADMSQNTR